MISECRRAMALCFFIECDFEKSLNFRPICAIIVIAIMYIELRIRIMTNYFEETDQMDIYNSLTDYQKGVLDGFLEIANMVEDEIADLAEEALRKNLCKFKNCDKNVMFGVA